MIAVDKIRAITLSNGWFEVPGKPYRIESVINSVDYEPGDFLTHEELLTLCNTEGWTVNIGRRWAHPKNDADGSLD